LRPEIRNPPRFFLKLGHPFCYIQSSGILYLIIVLPVSQDRKEIGTGNCPRLPASLYSFPFPKNQTINEKFLAETQSIRKKENGSQYGLSR
jgi:hypothetical protein